MTKQELLQYKPDEIRRNPSLYQAFTKLYKEEYGGGCSSCAFKSVINRWKNELNVLQSKNYYMKNSNNTFILKKTMPRILIPGTSTVINATSSDSLAMEFLMQENGKYFKRRASSFFEKLPDGVDKNGNAIPSKEEENKKKSTAIKKNITRAKNKYVKSIDAMTKKDSSKVKKAMDLAFEDLSKEDLFDAEGYLSETIQEMESYFNDKINSFDSETE